MEKLRPVHGKRINLDSEKPKAIFCEQGGAVSGRDGDSERKFDLR